jgi:hypothetical protein
MRHIGGLRLRCLVDGREGGLQDGSAIYSETGPGGAAGADERGFPHSDEGEQRPQIGLDEVERVTGSSLVVHASRGDQKRGLLVAQQAGGCAVLVGKCLADARHLVDPKLEGAGDREIMHGDADHKFVGGL